MQLKPVRTVARKSNPNNIHNNINGMLLNNIMEENNTDYMNNGTIKTNEINGGISGGRKGLEIARTIQNDIYYESQLNEGIEPEKNQLSKQLL